MFHCSAAATPRSGDRARARRVVPAGDSGLAAAASAWMDAAPWPPGQGILSSRAQSGPRVENKCTCPFSPLEPGRKAWLSQNAGEKSALERVFDPVGPHALVRTRRPVRGVRWQSRYSPAPASPSMDPNRWNDQTFRGGRGRGGDERRAGRVLLRVLAAMDSAHTRAVKQFVRGEGNSVQVLPGGGKMSDLKAARLRLSAVDSDACTHWT